MSTAHPLICDVTKPCNRCGKILRRDYSGLCMDCADELGLSEMHKKKSKEEIKILVEADTRKFRWFFFELFPRATFEPLWHLLGLEPPIPRDPRGRGKRW